RPVGQADVGAVYTFSYAGLAANRALQLDEPTGGVNARKSVSASKFKTPEALSLVNPVRTPAALCRLVNTVRRLNRWDTLPKGIRTTHS
ncbi:MAG: hypothetical protein ACK56W_10255, partial [Pirellula sp.]